MELTVLMENTACSETLCAEHGLSLYLEVNGRHILFDCGQSAAFADNAQRLGVELSQVDTAILSHGHYDHGGGLARFLELNDYAPVYLHRDAFQPHYHGADRYIGLDPALAHSPRLRFTVDETDLGDGLTLSTCNGRTAPYPVDSAGLFAETPQGRQREDFRHEQYLLIQEGERRILISGCSHKGVLNLTSWYQPDILIGGFHFMGIDPESPEGEARLSQAAEVLLSRSDTQYWTCHCTGRKPYEWLKAHMGARLSRLSTGDRITI